MNKFTVEISCKSEFWWRFNVYLALSCLDCLGNTIAQLNKSDEPYKTNTNASSPPENYPSKRTISLTSQECEKISIHLYILANTLPVDNTIKNSPEIEAELKVSCKGKVLAKESIMIDQFGGYSIAGKEFSI